MVSSLSITCSYIQSYLFIKIALIIWFLNLYPIANVYKRLFPPIKLQKRIY